MGKEKPEPAKNPTTDGVSHYTETNTETNTPTANSSGGHRSGLTPYKLLVAYLQRRATTKRES